MRKIWYAYWAALVLALLGLITFKNYKTYSYKPWRWKVSKSALEWGSILLAAAYVPALLVAYACIWITKPIKQEYLRMAASIVIGIPLMLLSNLFLEALVVISAFAIELLSTDLMKFYKERRDQRERIITIS